MMAVPTLLLTLATLLCASAAPAREVLFASSPGESIDTRSGAGLVSPWSGFDPQANAVTAYFSKDMTPTPTVMDGGVKSPKIDVDSEIDLSNGLGADNVRYRRRTRRARRRRPNARPPPRPSAPRPLAAAAARTPLPP